MVSVKLRDIIFILVSLGLCVYFIVFYPIPEKKKVSEIPDAVSMQLPDRE